MQEQLAELKQRLITGGDLRAAGSVLGWDQATYMPAGGSAARRSLPVIRRRFSSASCSCIEHVLLISEVKQLEPQDRRPMLAGRYPCASTWRLNVHYTAVTRLPWFMSHIRRQT